MSSTRGRARRGFTIVEVVIAGAMMALVIGVGYKFFASSQRSFTQGQFKYRVQHEAQKLIEWVKLDLLHSCKAKLDDPILVVDGDTYSFLKFTELVEDDKNPVPAKVTYTFDPAKKQVTRRTEGAGGGLIVAGKDIQAFRIVPYYLNTRYYFRIEVTASVDVAETGAYGERVELRTSVESRFENNLVNHVGWVDNPQTGLKK